MEPPVLPPVTSAPKLDFPASDLPSTQSPNLSTFEINNGGISSHNDLQEIKQWNQFGSQVNDELQKGIFRHGLLPLLLYQIGF